MSELTVPFDLGAERATLGACLLERDAVIAVAPWLEPGHFYLEKNAHVWEAIVACYERREPPDLATVAGELRRRGRLDLVGGLSFLGELAGEVPTAVHVEYYARTVERCALLRRLIQTGGQIAALGYEEGATLEDTFSQAEQKLFAVTQRRSVQDYASLGTIASEVLAKMQAQHNTGGVSGLRTGYADLDALTGGFQPSDLILLAARPAVGKSSLAMSLAYNVAHMEAAHVGVFSLEMGRDQLFQRLLAMHTGIDMQRLRVGNLREDERALAMDGMAYLSELPIYVDDTPALSVSSLRAKARRMTSEVGGLDLVVIDYLQLMAGGGGKRNDGRVQEVSEISRGLKQLARELGVPVIALSQLSRAVEERAEHIPMLSDLRESGSLEQDADIVMFIYREELYDKDTDKKGIAEVILAKHRNGPVGVVPLRFDARTTTFHNLDRYQPPAGY